MDEYVDQILIGKSLEEKNVILCVLVVCEMWYEIWCETLD